MSTLRMDPSRTVTLRRSFQAAVKQRIMLIYSAVRGDLLDSLASFLTEDQKLIEFNRRVERLVESQLEGPWFEKYARSAYMRAAERAFRKVRKDVALDDFGNGAANEFVRGLIHMRIQESLLGGTVINVSAKTKLSLLMEQAASQFKGVSSQIKQSFSRIVATGIAAGREYEELVGELQDVLEISWKKAVRIVNTEIVRIAAEGALDAYASLGVDDLELDVEFTTMEGACKVCLGLAARNPYKLSEARGIIPVHPECHCHWVVVSAATF